jgi:hypothetical protein
MRTDTLPPIRACAFDRERCYQAMVAFWTTSFAMEIANEYTCLDAVKSLGEEKRRRKT